MKNLFSYIFNKCNVFATLLILVISACTEDEIVKSSNNEQLQVNVNTNGPCLSRNIIHDEWLPDGVSIGISLFNTDKGGDYEDKGYNNIKFTSSGTAVEQKWTANKTVLLSDNKADLVAYYPWSDDEDLDLTAIPVENASQTDYMYSTLISGFSNIKSKADITMQHALTAIRVKLVLGDYSTAQNVTEVAVSSAGLATFATLNAFDGTLDNISGQYTSVSIDKVFSLATGEDTDFLFVPDASVTEGKTDVSIFVDGKEYCTSIDFKEAYKQGYIYTYILKWNHTGFVVDNVKVTPWNAGKDASDELQIYIPDDEYIVEITVPNDNYDFRHNINGVRGTIDWGDGTIDTYTTESTWPEHTYAKAGTYTVIVKGKLYNLIHAYYSYKSSKIISKLIHIGIDLGITEAVTAFYGQNLLTEILPGALDGLAEVKDFGGTFAGCTSLQTIPEGLFDKCTKATNFGDCIDSYFKGTFEGCTSLTEIPEGLFDKCSKVTSFARAFAGCTSLQTIPEGLFDKCTKVTDFKSTFQQCWNLKGIPAGLFDNCTEVTTFEHTFGGASGVTGSDPLNGGGGIAEIPSGLFKNNIKVTTFDGTFAGCAGLTSIPEGLFDNCPEVWSFNGTFQKCTSLTSVPDGLFDYNTNAYDFSYTFENCESLVTIPVRLMADKKETFRECDFYATFRGCINLKEVPEGLFENTLTEDYGFSYTFSGCSSLEKIGDKAFKDCATTTTMVDTFIGCDNIKEIGNNVFEGCTAMEKFQGMFANHPNLTRLGGYMFKNCKTYTPFYGCTKLTEISEDLFAGFSGSHGVTFRGCTSLTEIPEGLFDNRTEVTSFNGTFYGCSSLKSIPTGLFDKCTKVTSFYETFSGCTSLKNIPERLFDKCTKVTDFKYTFEECTNLTEIPEGLFDNCTEVTSFRNVFNKCTSLQAIPEGLFDKCTKVTDFKSTFANSGITAIPVGLFDKCTKVTIFWYTFYDCKNVTGESPYTIINIDGVDTKVHLYERSNYPEYFTAPTDYEECYYKCTGLTDYSYIPSNWK